MIANPVVHRAPALIVPPTWVSGTPRGFGDRRIENEWIGAMHRAIEAVPRRPLPGDGCLEVSLRFLVCPTSPAYRGQSPTHGPDLDNLVKLTIDGLSPLSGRGLGLIPNDAAVYRICTAKEIVQRHDEAGAWITLSTL
jgi:Holliday junction resolvase RusA-like endonuclease